MLSCVPLAYCGAVGLLFECRGFHGLKHGLWWSFWLELAQRRRSVKPGNMVLKRLLWRLHIHTLWAHPEGPRPTLHGLHSEEDPGQATADGRPADKDSQGGRSAVEEHERVGQGSTTPSSVLAQLGLAVAAGVLAGGKGCYAMEAAGGSAGWDPERASKEMNLGVTREARGEITRLGQVHVSQAIRCRPGVATAPMPTSSGWADLGWLERPGGRPAHPVLFHLGTFHAALQSPK